MTAPGTREATAATDARPSLRVLMVLPDLRGRGAERATLLLARGLLERGMEVHLAVSAARGDLAAQLPGGLRMHELSPRGMLCSMFPLARLMGVVAPDVVVSALTHANLVTLAAVGTSGRSRPVIVVEHTVFSRAWRGRRAFLVAKLAGILYARAWCVLAVSPAVAEDLIRRFRVPQARVAVVPNPLDLAAIGELAQATVQAPGEPLIVGVGRLAPEKDFVLLLRALSVLDRDGPVFLALVGEGPSEQDLRDEAEALGLSARVVFVGYDANPYRWMRASSAVVLSSHFEGMPTVAIEALSLGVPVVAVDPDGMLAVALAGSGFTRVPSRDPIALARCMRSAIDTPPAMAGALTWAERFSLDHVTDEWVGILAAAASGGRGRDDSIQDVEAGARGARGIMAGGPDRAGSRVLRRGKSAAAPEVVIGSDQRRPAHRGRRATQAEAGSATGERRARIAIYRPYDSVLDPSRYQVQELILARALVRRGFDVTVYSRWVEDAEAMAQGEGIALRQLHGARLPYHQTLDVGSLGEVLRAGFDVIQVHEESQAANGLLAWADRSPFVLYHGAYRDSSARASALKRGLRSTIGRRLRAAAIPVAKTQAAADRLRECGYPASRVIPVGFDEAYVTRLARPGTALDLGIAGPYLLGVGSLVPRKNWSSAVAWCAELRRMGHQVSLVLVGEGPLGPALDDEAAAAGLGAAFVRLTGLDQAQTLGLVADSLSLVHPSSHEEYGMVLLEALGLGTPVVAAPTAGSEEMLRGPLAGSLVPDHRAAIERLSRLVADPSYRAGQAALGRAAARGRLSADTMGDSFAGLYEALLFDHARQLKSRVSRS